jgi:hypothetical protein
MSPESKYLDYGKYIIKNLKVEDGYEYSINMQKNPASIKKMFNKNKKEDFRIWWCYPNLICST